MWGIADLSTNAVRQNKSKKYGALARRPIHGGLVFLVGCNSNFDRGRAIIRLDSRDHIGV